MKAKIISSVGKEKDSFKQEQRHQAYVHLQMLTVNTNKNFKLKIYNFTKYDKNNCHFERLQEKHFQRNLSFDNFIIS